MRKKKILIIVASILCVTAFYTFTKNRVAAKRRLAMKDIPQKVEQKILSFDLANYAEDGNKKWQLKGDCADILAEIVNLSNIDMETYDEPKITLTALKGTYDRVNKEISFFNDVEVLTSDGTRLTTDYLKWDGNTDIITTDKPVRIIRSDMIADGKGGQAMPQMKKLILNKDVRVKLATNVIGDIEIGLEEEESQKDVDSRPAKAIITCKGPMEIDHQKNIAIFQDDVLVDDKKGKIYSDRMKAFLDPLTKNIIKVVAEGNVRVIRGDDSTYSQKAIYTTEDQKIILIGKPKIYIRSEEQVKEIEGAFGGM